jgi:hypothetical protein
MAVEYIWIFVDMTLKEREGSVPVFSFPPQIQHGLPCELSQVSEVRSRNLLLIVLLNIKIIDKF